MTTTTKEELRQHVLAKKHELQAKMEKLKAEGKSETDEQVNNLTKKLKDVENMISNGWDNLSDATMNRLNEWLK